MLRLRSTVRCVPAFSPRSRGLDRGGGIETEGGSFRRRALPSYEPKEPKGDAGVGVCLVLCQRIVNWPTDRRGRLRRRSLSGAVRRSRSRRSRVLARRPEDHPSPVWSPNSRASRTSSRHRPWPTSRGVDCHFAARRLDDDGEAEHAVAHVDVVDVDIAGAVVFLREVPP